MKILKPHTNKCSNQKAPSKDHASRPKQIKVINFIGNMKENIQQLLLGMDCHCGFKKDFIQILVTYGDKIDKLRQERSKYKELLQQARALNSNLKHNITKIQNQMEDLQQNYLTVRKETLSKQLFNKFGQQKQILLRQLAQAKSQLSKTKQEYEQQLKEFTLNLSANNKKSKIEGTQKKIIQTSLDTYLLDDSKINGYKEIEAIIEQNCRLKQRVRKLDALFNECNLEEDQIVNVIRDYLSEMPCFSTREERELYRVASKMNNNLWKKRLQMQIKELQNKKQSFNRYQDQLKKREKNIFN